MAQRRRAVPRKRVAKSSRADTAATKAATEHFVEGVLSRGEAVPAGQDLPPGATHETVDAAPDKAVLRRKRFSLR